MKNPSSKSQTYIEKEHTFGAQNYHPIAFCAHKAKGVWLYDVDGNRALDMMSAYSAVSLGHNPKNLVKALHKQSTRLSVTSRAYFNDVLPKFLEALSVATGFDKALPMNTGAEAVETAIKVARKWGYLEKGIKTNEAQIIVCEQNFHGRTTTIVSFSSERQYSDNFGPFAKGFVKVPFGNIEALKKAINKNTCAFIVEPIQGEAGIVLPPKGYLAEVRSLCDANNVLLIADEVQTGFARTGARFAFEHENIRPDGLILGKALGGGMLPISAFCANKNLMDVIHPGDHGSTFGGNPLACAVALKALPKLCSVKLSERSARLGAYLVSELTEKIGTYATVKDIRGQGLFVALEIQHIAGGARTVIEALAQRGLISKDTHGTVIRLAPPLVIKKKHIDRAIKTIHDVMTKFELAHTKQHKLT